MNIRIDQQPDGRLAVTGIVDGLEFGNLATAAERQKHMREIVDQVQQAIVGHVAERFLAEHLQEVIAAINPQAVANLALLEAGRRIVELIPIAAPQEKR